MIQIITISALNKELGKHYIGANVCLSVQGRFREMVESKVGIGKLKGHKKLQTNLHSTDCIPI